MSAMFAAMALHGFWMLLASIALVLLVLGLMRALFPDFSSDDPDEAPNTVLPDRFTTTEPSGIQASHPRATLRNERPE